MAAEEKKKSSVLIIVLTLVIGLGGGAAAMVFLHPAPKTQTQDGPSKVQAVLHLETFTVDMSSPDQKAYLRVGVDLGLGHDLKKEDDGGTPTALVRDTVLGVLMASKPEDLVALEGRQGLKEAILNALHHRAPGLGVQEVYFTEFLLQR